MSDENGDKNKEEPRQIVALSPPEYMVQLFRILQAARHYVRQVDTASNEDAIGALDSLRAVLDSFRAVLDDLPASFLEFGEDKNKEEFIAICAPELMVKLIKTEHTARHYVRQVDTASNEDAIRALDSLRAVASDDAPESS